MTDGIFEFNVTVNPATYPENATVVVNSTVDGNYTVKVGNKLTMSLLLMVLVM